MQKDQGKVTPYRERFTEQDFPILLNGEIHLWSVSLNEDDRYIKQCQATLTDAEQERVAYFSFKQVQTNYIISQGTLRLLLSSYLGKEPQKVNIGRHEKGKPFSLDNPSLYFNMSNSGNFCVYAFSRDSEVGIDLEHIRELPDLDELIQKNFTPKETAYIEKKPEHKLKRFFQFWTFKESYLKATGEGMRLPPDNIEFSLEDGQVKLQSLRGMHEAEDWLFKDYSPHSEHIGTLTYKGAETKIKEMSLPEA